MARLRKNQNTKVAQIAAPLRSAIRDLLARQLTTTQAREALAKEIDQSIFTIRGMIYEGEGSFDALIAALAQTYGFDVDELAQSLLKNQFKAKAQPITEADRAWQALDAYYSQDDKVFLADLLLKSAQVRKGLVGHRPDRKALKKSPPERAVPSPTLDLRLRCRVVIPIDIAN